VVFAMDTGQSNMVSESGDLEFTNMRLRRPLEAMQMVRQQLVDEGIVDPDKSGITGLSYASDIAVYALVTTNIFKAAAVASSSLDPLDYTINSVKREKNLNDIGFAYPDDVGRESWKKISLALNADRIKTPLLIQGADSEAMFSLETFKSL